MTAVALDPEVDILWRPFPGMQTRALQAHEFEVLVGGSKGPGKSDVILAGSLRQVERTAYKALILRQSFPELQELIDRSHRIFPYLPERPSWRGSPLYRWAFPSGAVIDFGYCSRPEDVQRYHGKEYARIGFDELGDVADERVWTLLMAECRCPDPAVRRQMIASANPGKPGHPWIKRRFVDPCGKRGERVYEETFVNPFTGESFVLTRRYIPGRVTDNPVYANDPLYMSQLLSLPEVLRRQLLFGDWDAGFGLALDELDESVHMVAPFDVPKHWTLFGSFDWGYQHPWVFGVYAANEDGTIYKLDTVHGRHMRDDEIIDRIKHKVQRWKDLRYVVAGHDCWADYKAHGDSGPSTEGRFSQAGIPLTKAAINRPQGLNTMRHYFAWRGRGPEGQDDDPACYLLDTPGNRWCFAQLQGMVVDPDDPEDALKVNADPMTGEGGDDGYDETRYALASRPPRAPSSWSTEQVKAWAPATLKYEYETHRRRGPLKMPLPAGTRADLTHPTLGDML